MAKLDTSKIEGYEAMSAEDKVKVLEGLDIPEQVDLTGYVDKKLFDKKASELADAQKKLKESMTEDQRRKQEEDEQRTKLEEELEELRKESKKAKSKARFLSLGFDEKLAEETAQAEIDGDIDTVFANQKKHLENVVKQAKADALKGTPKPLGGSGGDTMTLEKLRKLSLKEQMEYSVNHAEEYRKLYETS